VKVGTRGPVGKRSEERIRRNKDEGGDVEKIVAIGTVEVPELDMPDAEQLTQDLYRSLTESAQARFFEPSDWQTARFALHFVDRLLKSDKPNGQVLATVYSMFGDLLMTEGSRRRLRLEIERKTGEETGEVIDVVDRFKAMLQQQRGEDRTPEGSSSATGSPSGTDQ
jgi:hypothetical protein